MSASHQPEAVSLHLPPGDNSKNFFCGIPRIHIPPNCRGQQVVIGVDEAGRGPVLGSLVYCAAFWPVSESESIEKLGFNDSKQLKESQRDDFFTMISSHQSIGWVIEELTPEKISEDMMRMNPISLNKLSYDAVVSCLEKIRDGFAPMNAKYHSIEHDDPPIIGDIFIDTVGDPQTYKNRLTSALGEDFGKFTIEKKADATYKVVGAASILAKVSRDRSLRVWQWEEKGISFHKDFGSGYPSDEVCVKWLERTQEHVFGFPSIVRHSWGTCRDILSRQAAPKFEWACEDETDVNTQEITSFFAAPGCGTKVPRRRPSYFTKRKMRRIVKEDFGLVSLN